MEIVVLDKVLQIDTSVWFFILFSVYLRVVRSVELQLFNYYLQWYSDTRGNFLQFKNLHDLVTLGNYIEYIAWKEHCGYFYRNAFTSSQSPRSASTHLEARKTVLFSSNISWEALTPRALVLLLSASSLSWAWPSWLSELCRCLCVCGPKILSRGCWGIKGGITPHCRMSSKLVQGR